MTDANVNLLLSCLNQKGLVEAISHFIFQHNGNSVHADRKTFQAMKLFFIRIKGKRVGFAILHGVKTVNF